MFLINGNGVQRVNIKIHSLPALLSTHLKWNQFIEYLKFYEIQLILSLIKLFQTLFFFSGETASLFPEMSQNVSKEIEDEANSYFQRIYNHPPHPTLSIDEVLEMLSKFKESTSKRERVRGRLHSYVGILLNSISDKLIPNLINSDAEYRFLQN